jgi:hypothetical protein
MLRDEMLEAIGRWSKNYEALFSPTLFNGAVHKSSGIVEEIIRSCVDTFLTNIDKDDRPGIDNPGKAGMGEQVRTLKRLVPILTRKFPGCEQVLDARTLNLLDNLVTMRNDFMHRRLWPYNPEDRKKLIEFIECAKDLCQSELLRLAISIA